MSGAGLEFKTCGHARGFSCNCAPNYMHADQIERNKADARLDDALARVEELRAARASEIERRDRAAWDYILHTASQISFFKRQAG